MINFPRLTHRGRAPLSSSSNLQFWKLASPVTPVTEWFSETYLPHRIYSKRIRSVQIVVRTRIQRIICIHASGGDVADPPVRWKYAQWFGKHVVINKTRVHWEQTHQQNYITSTKEDVPYLKTKRKNCYISAWQLIETGANKKITSTAFQQFQK